MRISRLATIGLAFLAIVSVASVGRAADGAPVTTSSSPTSSRRVLFSAGGAAIIGVGLPEFSAAGGLALGLQEDWAVVPRLRLGLAQAIALTSLPYGNSDGEPAPFRRLDPQQFESDVSLPTRIMATVTVDLDRVQLDAGAGVGFLVSPTMGPFSVFPAAVGQAGVTVPLGAPGTPYLLRAAVWRTGGWDLQPGQSIVVPELSFVVRL